MPSPIGHALGAMTAGWMIARPEPRGRDFAVQSAILAALGAAPDLDLLIGRHSNETHSLGAALIAASVAAWWRWPVARTRGRIWLAAFAAWFSHPVLDALAADTSPPLGVMLLWPFTRRHFISPWSIFEGIDRHWRAPGFFAHDLHAMLREIAILAPIAAATWWVRRRRPGTDTPVTMHD